MNICIIPAKSHSVRIPGKNIREFCGKPVIEYTLEAVKDSEMFDEIVVSTDSDEIGSLAAAFGATYFKRSPDNMLDDSPMVDALLEVLPKYPEAKTVCMAYACSPFIKSQTIKDAYSQHEFHKADVTTAVYASTEHAEYALLQKDGKLMYRSPEYKDVNSLAFPDTYQNAGQFYIADVQHLEMSRTLAPMNMCGVVVDHGIDIDTESDWQRAEALYILNNHPSFMRWSMQNSPIIAECDAMRGKYGSVTINYVDGEVKTIDRQTRVRQGE